MLSLQDKLAILADSAKYDASCASSAAPVRIIAPDGKEAFEGLQVRSAWEAPAAQVAGR